MATAVKIINQAELNKLTAAQCSMKWNGVAVKVGDVIPDNGSTILITANAGRIFSGTNNWRDNSGTYPFTIAADGKTGTLITKSPMSTTRSNSTYTTIEEPTGPVLYTYNSDDKAVVDSSLSTIFKNNVACVVGDVFRLNDVIKIVANSTKLLELVQFSNPSPQLFTVNESATEAVYTFTTVEVSGLVVSVRNKPVVVYTVKSADITQLNSDSVRMLRNGAAVSVGTQYYITDVMAFEPSVETRQLYQAWLNTTDEGGSYLRINLNIVNDGSLASQTIDNERPITSFIARTEIRPVKYGVTQNDLNRMVEGKAVLRVNGVIAVVGTQVGQNDTMTITANSGRVFYDGSVYAADNAGGRRNFAQNEDFTIATLVKGSWGISGLYADTVLAPSPDVRGYNNVYELSETQLKQVTQKRWEVNTAGDVVDYGKFFIGLISLPFTINPDYVVGDQDVRLGPLDTDIPAKLLDRDIIRLDLGTIRVVSEKGNLLDYKNTVAMLYLPYTDPVAIDLEYVIDQEIAIEYAINLYDGVATVNVMSSKIDNIVLSISVDMGISIPFANVEQTPAKNNPLSIKMGFDNGIKVPFIEIMRNESVLSDGFFTIPIIDESAISEASGFIRVEEVSLVNSKATKREKDAIVSLLKGGVIV